LLFLEDEDFLLEDVDEDEDEDDYLLLIQSKY
jgi:hypothetical protein